MIEKSPAFSRKAGATSKVLKALFVLILAGALIFGALFGAVISGSHDHIQGEPEVMVILGCQVKPWGPSILLQDRLDKALDYLKDHPNMTVVVSGGQGADEHISEAQAMADYLMEHGLSAEQLILEDQSYNTVQNLSNTRQLLERLGYDTRQDIAVVSNGFHLTRVRMIWSRVWGGDEQLSTLAAPSSHVPSRLKMFVREPLALVKSFLLD